MATPSIDITSLGEAVEAVLTAAGHPCIAKVSSVRAADAFTLLHLLASLEDPAAGWVLANKRCLKRAVIAVDLLTIVSSALLPVLCEDLAGERALAELRRYAFRVKDCTRMVGGTFSGAACLVADLLLNHRNQARHHAAPPVLVENARNVRAAIAQFKVSEFTLLEVDDRDRDRAHVPVGAHVPERLKMPAPPTVRVTSLKVAMEAALESAGDARGVLVGSVHLRHATALEELLRYEDVRNGWELLNRDRVQALALADNVLLIISQGVLPGLAADPTNNPLLDQLNSYIGKILVYAAVVGGSAQAELNGLTDSLLGLIHDVALHPLVTLPWLSQSAQTLTAAITTLRSRQLTLAEGL